MNTKIGEKLSIDSLKVRIPFAKVNNVSEQLQSNWLLINEATGERDETFFKKNSYPVREYGITTHFGIEDQITAGGEVQRFLIILLNAKILKCEYLQGITAANIKIVYDSLMNYNLVSFTLDDLMNAECTDVDFKKDTEITPEGFSKVIKKIAQCAKPSKKKNQGYRSFDRDDNRGIEFSDRPTTAYKSNPFMKIYHKGTELNNKSSEFAQKYLAAVDYTNIARIECTVKNKAHFRYLGVNDTSLCNLLNLSDEVKETILNDAISKHLEKRVIEIKNQSELKPDKMIIYNMVVTLMHSGYSYETIRNELALQGIDNRSKKSQKGKDLDDIYLNYIKGSSIDKTTKEVDQFFGFMGWN